MKYDFLIVGAGFYGAVCARQLTDAGFKCLVIDKRNHIGGNCYTENIEGVQVHKYGAHIFHTSNERVWQYVNQFAEFNNFVNSPIAIDEHNNLYNLPFNMNTFNKLYNVITPQQAKDAIEKDAAQYANIEPTNLEEQAIKLVGKKLYDSLIKGYTEKQWGCKATELPASIIKRLPLRFTYDNNYFNDKYQGIPIGGYTKLFEKLLDGIDVKYGVDFFDLTFEISYAKLIYTGPIDRYFNYKFGKLNYRSLRFENEIIEDTNVQGNAVVNYTASNIPYTRIIEHRHFDEAHTDSAYTVLTKEYPADYTGNNEPYYPINDDANNKLYEKYKEEASKMRNIYFGGRLAEYKYYDMHQVIESALNFTDSLINKLK